LTRATLKLLLGFAAAAILFYVWLGGANQSPSRSSTPPTATGAGLSQVATTWGNRASLPDHFARHGSDFGARSPEEYAFFAAQFLQRARVAGWSAKVDDRGVLRVFDPGSGSFGAYNPDGTTKTFFKPRDATYFQRQPGRTIDLKTWR
jgi:pyocin large subunit-like protein